MADVIRVCKDVFIKSVIGITSHWGGERKKLDTFVLGGHSSTVGGWWLLPGYSGDTFLPL